MTDTVRPTEKQRELLVFIEQFIEQHGYSPSYREIMTGLDYTSVATVSLHVTSLIRRGHVRKRDRSARSLEVVKDTTVSAGGDSVTPAEAGISWLATETDKRLLRLEVADVADSSLHEAIAHLIRALEVLGHDVSSYIDRLEQVQAGTMQSADK